MPVFISYSHENRDFVDKLAVHLTLSKVHVWVDRWELHVGDSIIAKIQQVIQEASALIVVLSHASVQSEWCKKELSAGLVRELEEKRVVVLPLLLEDCQIPMFLRDKLYADFRTNYDAGLRQVLEAVAKVTSDTLGRVEEPQWHTDWVLDWGDTDGNVWLRLTFVIQGEARPYSVLAEVHILCNDIATARYKQYADVGLEPFGRLILLESLRSMKEFAECEVVLPDNFPQTRKIVSHDSKTKSQLNVTITCRRLGEDTGRDILLHLGRYNRKVWK
jgi:TIR domain